MIKHTHASFLMSASLSLITLSLAIIFDWHMEIVKASMIVCTLSILGVMATGLHTPTETDR